MYDPNAEMSYEDVLKDRALGKTQKMISQRIISAPDAEDIKTTGAASLNTRQANIDLASKISGRIAKDKGIAPEKMQKGINLSQQIAKSSGAFIQNTEDSIAKDLFRQKYGVEADSGNLDLFKKNNNQRIQDSIYGQLSGDARSLGMDLTKDSEYTSWVARDAKAKTPKKEDESWGTKIAQIGKSLFDTVAGTATIMTDAVGLSDHAYKDWFGEQTSLKGNEGAGTKAWDLLFTQQAWVDVAFAAATALTGGIAAPAWIGAKTAAGAGLKVAGKTAFKFLEKEAVKEGTELLTKSLLKEGVEAVEKNMVRDLSEKLGGEVAEQALKAFKTGDGIMDLVKSGAKGFSGKEIGEALVESVGKNLSENLTGKAAKKAAKTLDKFGEMVNTIHGVGQLTNTGKKLLATSHLVDALGIPGFSLMNLAPTGVKAVEKEGTKGIGEWMAKQGVKPDTTFMRVGLYGGLPFAGTLPGVGNFIQENVMMLGTKMAGMFVEQTRGGVVERERQQFIKDYGIDPETSQEDSIKQAFEQKVNFIIRNSLPSEILTGTSYSERGAFGTAGASIVDGLLNMSGLMIGHALVGSSMGFANKALDPITVNSEGKLVSRLGFVQSLRETYDLYSKGEITSEEKNQRVQYLKDNIDNEEIGLAKTIYSVKELESVQNELMQLSGNGKIDTTTSAYFQIIGEALKEGSNIDSAVKEANERIHAISNDLFSEKHIAELTDKAQLLEGYLKKQAESTNFLTQVMRPLVGNLFTTSALSPTHAALNYSKMDGRTDSILETAAALRKEISEPFEKMALISSQKGELMKNAGLIHGKLEAAFIENLTRQGATPQQAADIWKPLSQDIQQKLTRVFLDVNHPDIVALFQDVFSDIGIKIKKNDGLTQGGGLSGVAKIIAGISAQDAVNKTTKLGSLVQSWMDGKTQRILNMQDNLRYQYASIAEDLTYIDRSVADAIGYKNHNDAINKIISSSDIPAEMTREATDKEKQSILNNPDLTEEEKTAIKNSPAEVITPIEITPDVIKAVATPEVVAAANHDRVVDAMKDIHENTEKAILANQDKNERISKALTNVVALHQQRILSSAIADLDLKPIVSKNDDDAIRNMNQITQYHDFILKSINDLPGFINSVLDLTGDLTLQDIPKLDKAMKGELKKVIDQKIALINYDEPDREKSNKALGRLVNEALEDVQGKFLTMDSFSDIAKQSLSAEEFYQNMQKLLVGKIGFTEDYANKVLDNSFQNKLPYIYNLYKNRIDMPFVNIGKNGKVESSQKIKGFEYAPDAFKDTNGNTTHLVRLAGPMGDLYKETGAVIVNKYFDEKGKEIVPKALLSDDSVDDNNAAFKAEYKEFTDVMEKNGFEYVGSFQEEGKKMIFVPKGQRDNFIVGLIGVTPEQVNKLSTEMRYNDKGEPIGSDRAIFVQEAQKRIKQIAWNEITLDEDNTRKYLEKAGRDKLKFIQFSSPRYDGESLFTEAFQQQINYTIGQQGVGNRSSKTAISSDNGILNKSQSQLFQGGQFAEPGILKALIEFARTDEQTYNGQKLRDVIAQNDMTTKQGRNMVARFISENHVVDGFVSNTSQKIIGSKISAEGKATLAQSGYIVPEFREGGVFETTPKRFAVKAVNESVHPEVAKEETVSVANQILRGVQDRVTFSRGDESIKGFVKDIYSKLNDLKQENLDELSRMVRSFEDGDPITTIQNIAERFNIDFSDPNFQQYANTKNIQNILNMITNIAQQNINTGLQLKGNSFIIRSIPDADNVESKINEMLAARYPGVPTQDNFVIVSRENYGHLERDPNEIPRYMTYRYPIADTKVLNYPFVIFAEDLNKFPGLEHYDIDMDHGLHVTDKLMKRIEGDNDGDHIYLVSDERLDDIKPSMEGFFNKSINEETVTYPKTTRDYGDKDFWGILHEAGFNQLEGKVNIGKIDKMMTIADLLIKWDIINEDKDAGGHVAEINLRRDLGKALQVAVDGGEVNMKNLFGTLSSYFEITSRNFGNRLAVPENLQKAGIKKLSNIRWEYKNQKGEKVEGGFFQFGEGGKKTDGTKYRSNGFIASNAAFTQIQGVLSDLKPGDYKMEKDKFGNDVLIVTKKGLEMNEIFQKYTFNNVKKHLNNLLNFIGKVDYTDTGEAKNRQINKFADQCEKIKPSLEFFKKGQADGIFNGENYLTDHFEKLGSKMQSFSSDMKDRITTALNTTNERTFGKIREKEFKKQDLTLAQQRELRIIGFAATRNESEMKKIIKQDFKDAGKRPPTADELKERIAARIKSNADDVIAFKRENPGVSLSDFYATDIQYFSFRNLPLKLFSEESKKNLNASMTRELVLDKVGSLSKFTDSEGNPIFSKSDIIAMKEHLGKDTAEETINNIFAKVANWQTGQEMNPYAYAMAGVTAPDSIKVLVKLNITPQMLTDRLKQIQSEPDQSRKQIRKNISAIIPENIQTALKNISDPEILKAAGELIGLKDIIDLEATNEAIEHRANISPLIAGVEGC